MKKLVALLFLLGLSGCAVLEAPITKKDKANQDNPTPVTVNMTRPTLEDAKNLQDQVESAVTPKIDVAVKNSQAQMTGLLNASDLRLADKITGVESAINTKVDTKFEASATAYAKLEAEFNVAVTQNAVLNTKVQADAQIITEMKADIKVTNQMVADLKVQLSGLTAQTTVQAGLLNQTTNRVENLTNTAGRDVNYLPKEVVEIAVAALLCLGLMMTLLFRNASERERLHATEEREERQLAFSLLYEMLESFTRPAASVITRGMEHHKNIFAKPTESSAPKPGLFTRIVRIFYPDYP